MANVALCKSMLSITLEHFWIDWIKSSWITIILDQCLTQIPEPFQMIYGPCLRAKPHAFELRLPTEVDTAQCTGSGTLPTEPAPASGRVTTLLGLG